MPAATYARRSDRARGARVQPEAAGRRLPGRLDALTPAGVLALQGSAGNGAVATLLRQPAPVVEQTVLKAARFADDERLQRAARNSPPLRFNEVSDSVARVQRAFLDLGYKLPDSTKRGWPDGHYGPETARAVRRFQEEHGVPSPSGLEAGRKTLAKLDGVFVKRDAALELPPALQEVTVKSTRPAVEKPDDTVTKPEAAVTPISVAKGPEAQHEHAGQIEISGGLEGEIHLGKPPPDEKPSSFSCDHVKLQVSILGNINLIKLGDRVTLFPKAGLDFNVNPASCGTAPGVAAHVDLLKLKLTEAVEMAVMTSFEPTDIGITGWMGKKSLSFEAKPFKGIPFSVGVEGAVGVQRMPIGSTGHIFWFLEGGLSAKVEFGFF
jgi:peptidoglycan hydrolase-like protein with peptidoglycan-binding domain